MGVPADSAAVATAARAAALVFGPLRTVRVPVGIDDALWRGRERGADELPGQQELAA
ncbi:MAG: hypothetical protein WKF65_08700 [Gaiellaceae bacterium]